MRYLHNDNTMLIPKFQNKAVVYYASSTFVTNFEALEACSLKHFSYVSIDRLYELRTKSKST